MYSVCLDFCNWLFNGASSAVVDFMASVLTIGCLVFALLPICLIIKYIFKR